LLLGREEKGVLQADGGIELLAVVVAVGHHDSPLREMLDEVLTGDGRPGAIASLSRRHGPRTPVVADGRGKRVPRSDLQTVLSDAATSVGAPIDVSAFDSGPQGLRAKPRHPCARTCIACRITPITAKGTNP
ncbi:MAG: hypothetical protein AAGI53_17050, partial [Planctomycetota bacterium]